MRYTPGRRGCVVSLRLVTRERCLTWYVTCDAVSGELITDAVLA